MPRQKRLDREDLLAKAIEVMRRNGYRETSLEELAREFNFTKPALYYYVSSKEALLYEIYEKTIQEWLAAITDIAADSRSAPHKIREVVRRFMHLCVERDEMAVFFSEKAYLSEEHFLAISEKEREVIDIIAGIIDSGVREGTIRPVPAKAVAFGLVGMTAWSHRWFQRQGSLSIDDLAGEYFQLLWGGLNAEAASADPERRDQGGADDD